MGATRRTLTIFPPVNLSSATTLAQPGITVKCQQEMRLAECDGAIGRSRRSVLLDLTFPLLVPADDLLDVRARFMEWRDSAVTLHIAFAGVVGGDGVLKIAVKTALQVFQIANAGVDVLLRIVEIFRAEPMARARHELHQALGANGRTCTLMELRLGFHDCRHERRINVVFLRFLLNDAAKRDGVLEK